MSPLSARITHLERSTIRSRYPRTIGRNARLGSHGSGPESQVVILHTDSGISGWGLVAGAVPPAEQVVGRTVVELFDPAVGTVDASVLGLDFALHDLAGQLLNLPVHQLLGARGESSIPAYDGAIYFDDLDPQDAPTGVAAPLANCAADYALGYRAFKLKIGRGNRWLDRAAGDARDIEVTHAVRAAYPDAHLLVDANDGYDCDGFLRYLDAVAECDLYWVEEPFLDDADDLTRLRKALDRAGSSTLIAEGETDPDVAQLLRFAEAGVIDVVLLDIVSYGFTAWRSLLPRLADLGVTASPHAWGVPLKTLYAAQLAAGLGNVGVVEGVPGQTLGADTSGYRFDDGLLTVPDSPGFGIPLDPISTPNT
ncbi:enolase C-terminal domain-like protein [Actinopolymorpha sp. B9G3]|uniref:enolase C-terminal domain-like protein n=1 Tax=Actinopolymorpha sp. B9G3 TaxID=3158970 RepID=UPI0032D9AA77